MPGRSPPVIYGQEVLYAARGQDARSRPAQARLQGCAPAWMQVVERRREQAAEVVDVSSPPVVCLNQIGETGTMRQLLYMKGDSNEHAQER